MRIADFLKTYKEPHDENVQHLKQEQARLGGLYTIINDPAFVEIVSWVRRLRKEGLDELEKDSDKNIFGIFLCLRRIWQAREKIKVADRFLAFLGSVPQRLQEVSEELQRLTKP